MKDRHHAPRKQRRKRHHYLPESYLLSWADDREQVMVRRRDRNQPFPSAITNVAVEAGLYAIPTPDGPDDSVEVALSDIEGPLSNHLAVLREERTPSKNSDTRWEISYLIALQLVRTPEHMGRMMFPEAAAKSTGESPISRNGMRRFLAERYLGEDPEEGELQGALTFANYLLSKEAPTKEEIMASAFRLAEEEYAPRLTKMAWSVERSPKHPFITTDRPVAAWRRDPHNLERIGAGLESADEVHFPLGPNDLLVLRPRFPEKRYIVEPERAKQVNRHLSTSCYQMAISRLDDVDELTRVPLSHIRPALRFNLGPLFTEGVNGNLLPTGREILHMYVPYGDNTRRGST
ncbi:DUF4238 domain-containing protein [Herbidospora galbida]|uniref:DUF4238 domain-containing protein n=1 Tax=Herbidospora galbida TaxID=2575442 RepID=A0A4U3MI02_9ACTN|nr:DUF4238 domain-containing protein [Herbidospora galbida]TKK88132.1 DUF4238 domain-containing protein [Herbidospora galbida]